MEHFGALCFEVVASQLASA